MAFSAANLGLQAQANGFNRFRYDTTDTITTVDVPGYINNVDDSQNLAVGDIIEVVVWGTAVRTGTIVDFDILIVMVVAAAGDISLSSSMVTATPVTGA